MNLYRLLQTATFSFLMLAGSGLTLATQTPSMISLDENIKKLINTSGDYLLETSQTCSPGLMSCYIALQQGADQVNAADLYEALPDLARCILMWSSRANRPESLGNGAPVGANGCDLSPLLQLLQAIQCSINTLEANISCTAINISCTAIDDLIVTITNDFASTWTILDEINTTLTTCCSTLETLTTNCAHTPICAPTTISTPGAYCLCQDITGLITIDSDNVDFDLNNHTISGATNGVVINPGVSQVTVRNGYINQTSTQAIIVGDGASFITLDTLEISNTNTTGSILAFAIDFQGSDDGIFNALIHNVTIGLAQSGISFANTHNSLIDNVRIEDIAPSFGAVYGILLNSSSNNVIKNALINNLTTPTDLGFGIQILNSTNTSLENCIVNDISPFLSSAGISVEGGSVANIKACSVLQLASSSGTFDCIGFNWQSSSQLIMEDCQAFSIGTTSTTINAIGFKAISSTDGIITNFRVAQVGSIFNSGNSFGISGANCTSLIMQGCTCVDIIGVGFAQGFNLIGSNIVCQECTAETITGQFSSGYSLGTGVAPFSSNISLINCYTRNVFGTLQAYGFSLAHSFGYLGTCDAEDIKVSATTAATICRGFDLLSTTTEIILDSCVVNDVQFHLPGAGEAFNLGGSSTQLQNCSASNAQYGISIPATATSTFPIINQCRASHSSITGINDATGGTSGARITNNYATLNGTGSANNYAGVSNTVALGTPYTNAAVVTGFNLSA